MCPQTGAASEASKTFAESNGLTVDKVVPQGHQHKMAPHATLPDYSRSPSISSANSYGSYTGSAVSPTPYLRRPAVDEVHDLVCVGFGPASLSVAVALHDSFEYAHDHAPLAMRPKVVFLESQESFAWHAGMQIPGAKMQISFLKDLATQRNPRSHFTFINYLFQNKRLNQFSNLSTFLPRRAEYEDYMRWAAEHFSDVVSYGQAVTSVTPNSSGKAAHGFTVTSHDVQTGETSILRTKHVLIAVGGRPKIPVSLPQDNPRMIHSSKYQRFIGLTDLDFSAPVRIAVIGGGQSAAEIFSDLPTRFPNSRSYLMIKGTALRPSDDSPFVNEVFDPERVDDIYATAPDRRRELLLADKATNYGVVRLELLEHLYEELYTQRILYGNDESIWPRRILHNRYVTAATDNGQGLTLAVQDTESGRSVEDLHVDLVFVASGYQRDMHEEILRDCRGLLPQSNDKFEVERDYSVRFGEGKVAKDAGVWLQGCNEQTHGLSDTLLSILAVRGGEIVESIFGR